MRALAVSAALLTGAWIVFLARQYHLDLDVYRIGVNVWLSGGDIYGTLPPTLAGITLPFIYPPISAVAMVPLTAIPFPAASAVLVFLSVVCAGITLAVTLTSVKLSKNWLVVIPLVLLLEPFRATLDYGQVNIVLMVLVAVDCLAPTTRWPRGLLVGLAAALKLTPAAFVLFFLLRRDWKSLVTAGVSFAAATAIGFVAAWDESVRFWTTEVFATGDKVGVGYISNQSILGVLTRADATWLWPLLAVGVLALTIPAMRRSAPATAFSLNALAMLLVSPISWSHHWVWCLPVIVAFAAQGHRVLAGIGLGVFVLAPHWWGVPVLENGFFAFAIASLAVPVVAPLLTRREDKVPDLPPAAQPAPVPASP
ncbi:glycosyltransferase 87 family protein [Actinokineospora auranticolor]|nr:glycosyltransferase 87 family protein [Actinokineospora auranticolor]